MRRCRINLTNRCQRLISRAEWPIARVKGASGESKGLRCYDKENLLWQFTVAIRSDPVGSGYIFAESAMKAYKAKEDSEWHRKN